MSGEEPDQEAGLPHPRETYAYYGNLAAEALLAQAVGGDRPHHAWLLTGAKGVGKATLAYRFARRALGARPTGPRPLDSAADDPVCRRIAALAHPDLFVLRRAPRERGTGFARDISAEHARDISEFFSLKPAEGGMRIAVIDAVDEMNPHAANAILKTLEEPPPRAALLLVCHQPGAVLATIRSRCRRLRLEPTSPADVGAALSAAGLAADPALIEMAQGRAGRALLLSAQDALGLSARLQAGLDRLRAGPGALIAALAGPGGANPPPIELALDILEDALRKAVLSAVRGEGAAPLLAGSTAAAGAAAWAQLRGLRTEADRLDMDPMHTFLQAVEVLDRTLSGSA